ncbi:hypothetical protein RQP46_005376 [Phenoliferia psychrophenolica]
MFSGWLPSRGIRLPAFIIRGHSSPSSYHIASSRPGSPDDLFVDVEDKGQLRSSSSGRRSSSGERGSTWTQVWLWASPAIILALLMIIGRKRRSFDDQGVDKFNVDTDYSLTGAQCDRVFPGLYAEADRARDYWLSRGGLNLTDLDAAETQGNARAMIKNNRLYIKSYSDNQQGTRTKATLAAINEALITSLEPLPDVEFVLQTGDTGLLVGAPWVLGREADEEALTLMPDYAWYSWPEPGVGSFLEVQDKTLLYESQLAWKDKIPKLFWKGALMVAIRKELLGRRFRH